MQLAHTDLAQSFLNKRLKLQGSLDLTPEEKDVIQVFPGDVSRIRPIKATLPGD